MIPPSRSAGAAGVADVRDEQRPLNESRCLSPYGPPHVVVHIEDVDTPVPKGDEVLIRVRAASVNPLDEGVVKGSTRIVGGLRRPKVTRIASTSRVLSRLRAGT
jgi:hypothetical protein